MPSLRRFFLIGAGRCGTTSLCAWLEHVPGVVVCDPKEPNFFCDNSVYCHGLGWYESLFAVTPNTVTAGEGSVLYSHRSFCEQTAERVHDAYPHAKIIFVARNPLSQMLSNWRYSWTCRADILPFSKAIRENPSYLERCDYGWQLEPYARSFPQTQIHVAFFEDLVQSPADFLSALARFLELQVPKNVPGLERLNASDGLNRPAGGVSRAYRVPAFLKLRQLVPKGWRTLINRMTSTRPSLPADSHWTDETYDWAIDKISDRAWKFLERQGKPRHYWDLDRSSVVSASGDTRRLESPR